MTSAVGQTVANERQEPTFFARIPKMVIMDLDPYELALYCNFKQTASEEGTAFKSNKTLAKETKMSVRKVQDSRKTLETKGLIKLEYIRDENGVVNQTVRVTIVDVWAENHNRFSGSEKIIPMHEVHTPHAQDAQPHAPDATKEEPNKKNQKEENTIAATQSEQKPDESKKDNSSNEWYDVVKDVFDLHGGRNANMQKMLQGHATDKAHKPYNLEVAITIPELREWGQWYRTHELGGNAELSMVQSPTKIQSSIIGWREKKQKPVFDNRLQARKAPANLSMLQTVEGQSA